MKTRKRDIIFYEFDCGCTIDQDHVKRENSSYFCPVHKTAKTISRYRYCDECGELFAFKRTGCPAERCPHCDFFFKEGKKYLRAIQRTIERKNRKLAAKEAIRLSKLPKKHKQTGPKGLDPIFQRNIDCIHYRRCMDFHTGCLMTNRRACYGCNSYFSINETNRDNLSVFSY